MSKRRALTLRVRFAVLSAGRFRCHYCGRRPPDAVLQVDHIVPVAEGGTNDPANLTVSRTACNLGKGARLLPDVTWQPFKGTNPRRCLDNRHDAPWEEHRYGAPDGTDPSIALVCTACRYIVATRALVAP